MGYNVSKALTRLCNQVDFLARICDDSAGALVRSVLDAVPVNGANVLTQLPQTSQSVILYDADGRRHIFTDLKD